MIVPLAAYYMSTFKRRIFVHVCTLILLRNSIERDNASKREKIVHFLRAKINGLQCSSKHINIKSIGNTQSSKRKWRERLLQL